MTYAFETCACGFVFMNQNFDRLNDKILNRDISVKVSKNKLMKL